MADLLLKSPVLTIIVLTYNQVNSIGRAIDSILEQTTTYPYEIWICDDCSTDGTLDVCRRYAKQLPDRIRLLEQTTNTYSDSSKEFHLVTALKNIRSPYFCILEGDDAWCDKNKIQIALNFMEHNLDYVIFTHDTIMYKYEEKTGKSLVHEVFKINVKNPVTFETAPLFHTSSRVYRNIIQFTDKTNFSDIFVFYSFLDKGPLYYHDTIMSVYNFTGRGIWSTMSKKEGRKINNLLCGYLNMYFQFRYNDFFTRKAGHPKSLRLLQFMFKIEKAWQVWIRFNEWCHRDILRKLLVK